MKKMTERVQIALFRVIEENYFPYQFDKLEEREYTDRDYEKLRAKQWAKAAELAIEFAAAARRISMKFARGAERH